MDPTRRNSEHSVNPFFINRWSPRAFSSEPVNEHDLFAILEAAHWAPSCFNEQPWRFYVAKTEPKKNQFIGFLVDSNKIWAVNAPILIALVSKLTFTQNKKSNRWSSFDCGTAWGYLTMEAYHRGYITHAMGGFHKDLAAEALGLSADYQVEAIIALGRHGNPEDLPDHLQERELPSGRKSLDEVVFLT